MKKLFALVAVLMAVTMTAKADNDKVISFNQLPAKSQTFVKAHFADQKTSYIKMDSGFFDKDYDVIMADGTKMEFNKGGEWTSVECKGKAVPEKIIPAKIMQYVKANYGEAYVKKIEKGSRDTEVKLSTGVELKFNPAGDFLYID